MTQAMQAVRLIGFVIMALGAWYHSVVIIIVGLLVVAFGWLRGVILPERG